MFLSHTSVADARELSPSSQSSRAEQYSNSHSPVQSEPASLSFRFHPLAVLRVAMQAH